MDFLKKFSGSEFLPAGGSALAYSACLAICLIDKAVLAGKESDALNPDVQKNLLCVDREMKRLLADTEKLIDEDADTYRQFSLARKSGDKTEMKKQFQRIVEVSMKVMEKSDAGLVWILRLHRAVPPRMLTHLLVAGEMLMGSINGTAHVISDNLRSIKVEKKRENYLARLDELLQVYRKRYDEVRQVLC